MSRGSESSNGAYFFELLVGGLRAVDGRRGRADFQAFDKIMRRRGGKKPRTGDEPPTRAKNK